MLDHTWKSVPVCPVPGSLIQHTEQEGRHIQQKATKDVMGWSSDPERRGTELGCFSLGKRWLQRAKEQPFNAQEITETAQTGSTQPGMVEGYSDSKQTQGGADERQHRSNFTPTSVRLRNKLPKQFAQSLPLDFQHLTSQSLEKGESSV